MGDPTKGWACTNGRAGLDTASLNLGIMPSISTAREIALEHRFDPKNNEAVEAV